MLAPLFYLLLSPWTHLCLPVEFLQGRDGVGRVAEHCLSHSAGMTARGRAAGAGGAGAAVPWGPRRARPPCSELALLTRLRLRGQQWRRSGPAGRGSSAGRTRIPGTWAFLPASNPFETCGPFPSFRENFQKDLLF